MSLEAAVERDTRPESAVGTDQRHKPTKQTMTEPRRRALGWIGTRLSDHRAELVEVRDEVDSMRRAMDERIATAGKALTRLAAERGDLQRERDLLRQSLAEKSRVAARLRLELEQARAHNEELLAATLPAALQVATQISDDPTSPPEKSGFRQNLAMASELKDARAEAAALKAKLEEAEEDAARHSSRAALEALPYEAENRALRADLDAGAAELTRLRDALARAEDESARSEEAHRAEVRELTRRHDDAMAATAAAGATELLRAHAEEAAALRAETRDSKTAAAKAQAEAQAAKAQLANTQAQLASLEAQLANTQAQLASLEEAARGRDARVDEVACVADALRADLEAEKAKAEAAQTETERLRSELVAARDTQILPDLAALDEMESRLHSLAGSLRAREREVASLNGTVEAQVMERRALAEELRGAREEAAKLAVKLEKERELRRRAPRGSQNAGNGGGKDRPMTKSMSRAFKTLRY